MAHDRPGVGAIVALVAAALAFTIVWALPLGLAWFALADPQATYQASPAEAETPWSEVEAADRSTIALYTQILGVAVGVFALVGLALTWWPLVRGRGWAVGVVAIATLFVAALAILLHGLGFWQVYPFWVPAAAWVVGVVAAIVGLAVGRSGSEERPEAA